MCIGDNDDSLCGLASLATFNTEAGETYFLLVSAKEDENGPFDLQIHDIGSGDILPAAAEESFTFPFWGYVPIACGAVIMLIMALFWWRRRPQARRQNQRQGLSG